MHTPTPSTQSFASPPIPSSAWRPPSSWRLLFRRWWWCLLACAFLCSIGAEMVSSRLPRPYESHAAVMVRSTKPLGSPTAASTLKSEPVARTYAHLMLEPWLLERVCSELDLGVPPAALAREITVTVQGDTPILDVAVRDADPRLAKKISDTLVEDFIASLDMMGATDQRMANPRAHKGRASHALIMVGSATLPASAVPPQVALIALLAALAGLVVGGVLILLIDLLDRGVASDDLIAERLSLPVIGRIPSCRAARGPWEELATGRSGSPAVEAYRALRTNLLFSSAGSELRSIVVTSAGRGEGKSRTAANLAMVLAEAGLPTLLVDGNLRRPSLHRIFGTPAGPGLSGLLLADSSSTEAGTPVAWAPNLWLLPAGLPPHNPSELLGSPRMRALLGDLRTRFRFVVIDSPPVNAVADSVVLAAHADGVILVVDAGSTTLAAGTGAADRLNRVGAGIVGAVLNRLPAGGASFVRCESSAAPPGPIGPAACAKRLVDIVLASMVLLVSLPVFIVLAAVVWAETGRPILFRTRRFGEHGRVFTMYKFRTMVQSAETLLQEYRHLNLSQGMVKIPNDPRVTRVGRVLRRFSLDELPQLWNVLRGDMSLVGPRPHDVHEIPLIDMVHRLRFSVKPGLTGLWQVSARSDPALARRVYCDIAYVEQWSLWLDLKILLRTVHVVLGGRGGKVADSDTRAAA